ncbi:MAG: HAMP domain-containing sensor histidine kinase, partial [Cyanobacteria bacterium P01_A01_bin.116]
QPDEAHTQQWTEARDRGFEAIAHPDNDPLAQGDREDALTDWLENYGVEEAWRLAEPLAAGRIEPKTLDTLVDCWRNDDTELRDMGIRWLALSFDVMGMIRNGLDGAERISTLVQSMKSYSYMDKGAQQQVDIHAGIEDTLRLFAFKLKKGIKVNRKYSADLPIITAYGSELNQVWTNLIDNAIDALEEGPHDGSDPTITIRTCSKNQDLIVEIEDNGPGIPTEVKKHILDPFYTTKPMGKGSGLGLDVVRRVVENRHGGSLLIESAPGRTCFSICLPLAEKPLTESTLSA